LKEITMAKARLLQAACTVAMLAASPVFAQSNTPTGDTGAGGGANTPTVNETNSGNMPSKTMSHQPGMMRRHNMAMKSSKNNTSQDAAVDRLNEQSYQAAQQGQTFGGSSSGGGMAPAPSMSGASMPGGASSGAGTTGAAASGAGGGPGK